MQQLETLQQRVDEFNLLRLQYARDALPTQGRYVFNFIPVLLHYNNPLLPGFVNGDVPHGIAAFEPSTEQRNFVQDLSLTANCDANIDVKETTLLGLYTMGSTSSIGQCCDSDLDIWICHCHELSRERRLLLENKCLLITQWAETRGIEVNFFLVPDNKFRVQNSAHLSTEGCGSASHLLLLDEFYRSALCIAGKPLLWHMIPAEHEANYDQYVADLVAENKINLDDWLDLGGFGRIPAEEYFGSSLWQLYKGIDSPYKAVIKTLLMEAYSWAYPNTELISIRAKKTFHQQSFHDKKLDAYWLMLNQVTEYLEATNDHKRLELARRCFYLKTCDRLSQLSKESEPAWRRNSLQEIVSQWQWSDQVLQHLDNRENWKIQQVRAAHGELLEALMVSYRNLIRFARRNNIGECINPEDIGILSRKLYAAFESLPGKVALINPSISPDLSEPNLSVVQVPQGRSNPEGWYLYNSTLESTAIIGRAPLEHSPYLSKLIAWSYFNGLLVKQTKLHLFNQGSDLVQENFLQFNQDLAQTFTVRVSSATNLALSRPCEIRHLGIFLNLEGDPTCHWANKVIEFDVNASDVFSFGANKECLVGSVDLVYRNSWNEIRTLHFNGEESVVNALSTILGKMHNDAASPDRIDVFCYAQHFRGLIRNRFQQLVAESISTRLNSDRDQAVKTLVVGSQKFGVFYERRGVSVKKLENAIDFYSQIADTKLERMPLRLDKTHHTKTPEIVASHSSEGLVQFFFENHDTGFNIYIVDEINRVETYQHFSGNKEELVQGVNRFYTSAHTRQDDKAMINFNLPQFYEIISDANGELELLPYRSPAMASESEAQLSSAS